MNMNLWLTSGTAAFQLPYSPYGLQTANLVPNTKVWSLRGKDYYRTWRGASILARRKLDSVYQKVSLVSPWHKYKWNQFVARSWELGSACAPRSKDCILRNHWMAILRTFPYWVKHTKLWSISLNFNACFAFL